MKDIFEPIILKIIELVNGQIKALEEKRTRVVLLVGGFGQNNYLKERLRHSLNGVEVLQPPNAWTAIARGAVMMGLNRANSMGAIVSVVSRRARKHYGVEFKCQYDHTKHDDSKK
jgi:tRNA A37 threonylcarbamoyltransferase TsaD